MTPLPALPDFFTLRRFAEIDSTNDEARRLAVAGAQSGLVVWADRQTAGHGRQGRAWQSPHGNLYCSVLLRPDRAAADAAQLGFAAALAVCESLPQGIEARCKWPNDVLVGGRKIAGILLESEASGARVSWLIVGVGINLASHPEATDAPATSLAALGKYATPDAMLAAFCVRFLHWHETWRAHGFAPLRASWLRRAHALGDEIRVRYGAVETRGRFADLDASGALVLENAEGTRHIAAGTVFPAG